MEDFGRASIRETSHGKQPVAVVQYRACTRLLHHACMPGTVVIGSGTTSRLCTNNGQSSNRVISSEAVKNKWPKSATAAKNTLLQSLTRQRVERLQSVFLGKSGRAPSDPSSVPYKPRSGSRVANGLTAASCGCLSLVVNFIRLGARLVLSVLSTYEPPRKYRPRDMRIQ